MGIQSRNIITALLGSQEAMTRELQEQTLAFTRMLSRSEIVIVDQTRAVNMDAIKMEPPLLTPQKSITKCSAEHEVKKMM
jgi:hypothetical protein